MSRALLALIVVAVVLAAGASAIDQGTGAAGDRTIVFNETWTANHGTAVALNDSNIDGAYYTDDPDAWVNSTNLTQGVDYEWYDRNGTIEALAGGELNDGENASITYSYRIPSDQQVAYADLYATLLDLGPWVLIAVMAAIILGAIGRLT